MTDSATSRAALTPESAVAVPPADLGDIVRAYNEVTDRLQQSHELLNREVVRLQQELASANAALQRSRRLAALGEMAAGIAHEIRNPLASIQLYANMLENDLSDRPEQRDLADKIAQAVRGLDGIVNDVLHFSRDIRPRPLVCDLSDAIDRAVQAVRPLIESNTVQVDPIEDSIELYADPDLIHQVLVNLIRNGAEAMPDGGTLRLSAESNDTGTTVVLRDTGPGIDADDIDRIFNPFFTTRATGTGLGLAIVHRIIDAHGGTIAVHNDGGAVFTICLPNPTTDSSSQGGQAA